MGVCYSGPKVTPEDRTKSKEIDQQIRKDKRAWEHEVKLLLLGAGESGKSTIAKQMKIIHMEGFNADEKRSFRDIIHSNILAAAKALLMQVDKFQLKLNKKIRNKAADYQSAEAVTQVSPSIAKDLAAIWADKAIQKTYERSAEFQLSDSVAYWFQHLDRISASDYIPTEQDMLRARVKTTGISEIEFIIDGTKFKMVDVGGQRSERKKWIHCFQDVTAVIFCVALSEYDLKLYEDESVNRMHESLKLFDEICNSRWFSSVSMILFLNKSDIFKEKIKRVDLKVCFPDYSGGSDFDKASEFITQRFVRLNKNPDGKQVYPHVTCATDTENIKFVFNAVKNIILHQALDASGF